MVNETAFRIAEVAESADAQDLKSCEPQIRTGSSPVFGIKGRGTHLFKGRGTHLYFWDSLCR